MTAKEEAILRLLADAGGPVKGGEVVHAVRGKRFGSVDTSLVFEALLAKGFIERAAGARGRVYTIAAAGLGALGG